MVQNWENFSSPPGVFSFPAGYIAGFQFAASTPATGGVLTIPFGNIYERTPWGGVSSSSELVAGIGSGLDTEIFEAGTPGSLALDQFLGDGMTFGLTNNVSKVLAALNVQYVISTDYPDWAYASDPAFDPINSYVGFQQQRGFLAPVFQGGYQAVYQVPSAVGNISMFPSYLVYFGNSSLVYELLNEPWFNGSVALVNGSEAPTAELPELVTHATALVASPAGLANMSAATLRQAGRSGVPVAVLVGAADMQPSSAEFARNPWNASNAREFSSRAGNQQIQLESNLSALLNSGYAAVDTGVRAFCPPLAFVNATLDGNVVSNSTFSTTTFAPFPYWNSSIVGAGINNQGRYPYNGSVAFVNESGVHQLEWNFTANNSTFQYLNFNLQSLAGISGFEFNATTLPSGPLSFLMQILLNHTYADVYSYVSHVNQSTGFTTYSFYLPSVSGPGASYLLEHPGNISRFVVGLTSTGNFTQLDLSNFTG